MPQAVSANYRPRWAALVKPALGIALAMGVLTAGQAQAFVVNVNGQNWDVTTFTGPYDSNVSKFATPANGGVMPWWGQSALADQFANAVGSSLAVSDPAIPTNWGPFFGYEENVINETLSEIRYTQFANPGLVSGPFLTFVSHEWAQATLVPSSVPGPLPALGAAAAFGFSRKLRNRIKVSQT